MREAEGAAAGARAVAATVEVERAVVAREEGVRVEARAASRAVVLGAVRVAAVRAAVERVAEAMEAARAERVAVAAWEARAAATVEAPAAAPMEGTTALVTEAGRMEVGAPPEAEMEAWEVRG